MDEENKISYETSIEYFENHFNAMMGNIDLGKTIYNAAELLFKINESEYQEFYDEYVFHHLNDVEIINEEIDENEED